MLALALALGFAALPAEPVPGPRAEPTPAASPAPASPALAAPLAPAPTDDAPCVDILDTRGALDSLSVDRVHLELLVVNRLPVPVGGLTFTISLVTAPDGAPIPGWRLDHGFDDVTLEPGEQRALRIDRTLPARRSVPEARDIQYRVALDSYDVLPPSLEVAARLLESPSEADQRSALRAYEHLGERLAEHGLPREARRTALAEIARALARPPPAPDGTAALTLLIALAAAADLDDGALVPLLLALPEAVDTLAWTAALGEVQARLVDGSDPTAPRLELLAGRARTSTTSALDLAERGVRDAIVRLESSAVPELVRARALGPSPAIRARATRLLHALGRGSIRAQLAVPDADARARLIEVWGDIGSPEPVPALVELLATRRGSGRLGPTTALTRIGAAAIGPLVDALSTTDADARAAVLDVIAAIGEPGRAALDEAALRYGLRPLALEPLPALATRLAGELAKSARARWAAELRYGLDRVRSGEWEAGMRALDRVYAAAPDLYMQSAEPIARAYLARAATLYARGNYDAALETARTGLTVNKLPELMALRRDAELVLARGYLDLDQLERADEILTGLGTPDPEADGLRAKSQALRADRSMDAGELGLARRALDKARRLAPHDPALVPRERRLFVMENLAIVVVLALIVPGVGLGVVIALWRRRQAARLRAAEAGIDGAG